MIGRRFMSGTGRWSGKRFTESSGITPKPWTAFKKCSPRYSSDHRRDRCRPGPLSYAGWALDRLRKRRADAKQVALDGDVATLPAGSPGPEALAEWSELLERVRDELARLPGQQAEAFWLQCVEGMSQDEIGQHLGVNANAVGVLVHRARQRLRQSLAGLNPVKQDRG
jgi:RNA polymerase sigma factor (sigma-70 family)